MSCQGMIELTWIHDGDEITHAFPFINEVCDRCQGFGTHLTPRIGNHAYTPEEFRESFDEEEAEQYFQRGGMYDVSCEECKGNKVIQVVDEENLSEEEKKLFEEYEEYESEMAAMDAADRRTRWMEDGCPSD